MASPFLTSTLDGGVWSASRPSRFTLRETAPGTHWIGGCVGPRASLDPVVLNSLVVEFSIHVLFCDNQ
jgi:hypothetical protein